MSLLQQLRFLLLPVAILAATTGARAASAAPEAATPASEEKLQLPDIKLTHGPAMVKLGTVAEFQLPAGFSFVGPDSLSKFFELTQNAMGGQEVGVVIAPDRWMLFFDYDPVGYVKDDEKDQLNADKLYASMEAGTKANNEYRRKKGWDEFQLRGWTTPPHYDPVTNNLTWAYKISSSSDQHQSLSVNESIRLLGRGGVMKVTLVGSNENFAQTEQEAKVALKGFSYVSGEKYAEYKSGDKIAEYGLAALVVGGAGAVAVKAGLLGFLGKFWKAIVAGLIAVGAAISKMWNKITGRNPEA